MVLIVVIYVFVGFMWFPVWLGLRGLCDIVVWGFGSVWWWVGVLSGGCLGWARWICMVGALGWWGFMRFPD